MGKSPHPKTKQKEPQKALSAAETKLFFYIRHPKQKDHCKANRESQEQGKEAGLKKETYPLQEKTLQNQTKEEEGRRKKEAEEEEEDIPINRVPLRFFFFVFVFVFAACNCPQWKPLETEGVSGFLFVAKKSSNNSPEMAVSTALPLEYCLLLALEAIAELSSGALSFRLMTVDTGDFLFLLLGFLGGFCN